MEIVKTDHERHQHYFKWRQHEGWKCPQIFTTDYTSSAILMGPLKHGHNLNDSHNMCDDVAAFLQRNRAGTQYDCAIKFVQLQVERTNPVFTVGRIRSVFTEETRKCHAIPLLVMFFLVISHCIIHRLIVVGISYFFTFENICICKFLINAHG